MNKAILVTAIAGVCVVVAGVGTMVVTDKQIDSAIAELQQSVSAPLVLEVTEDSNSFTNRHVTFLLSLDEVDQPVKVIVDNEIVKRPWGTSITHKINIDDTMLLNVNDEASRALVQKYFVDQAILSGSTTIGLTGAYTTTLETLAFDEIIEEASLKFHPMTINAEGDMSGQLKMTGDWQGFEIQNNQAEQFSINWKKMTFDVDGQYINRSVFIGNQTVKGDGVEFLKEDEMTSSAMNLGSFNITSNGNVDGDQFDGDFSFQTDSLTVDDSAQNMEVTDVVLTLAIYGINVENYVNLVEGLNDMQVTGAPSSELMSEANILLQNGFKISLPEWQANLNGSQFSLDANFEILENSKADVNNPFSLMGLINDIKADANIRMDASLASIPEISEQLKMVMESGVLIEDGNQYAMSFSMEDGSPVLNGEPIALPF